MDFNIYKLIHPEIIKDEYIHLLYPNENINTDLVQGINIEKIEPSDQFSHQSLCEIKDHKWMRNCEFILLTPGEVPKEVYGTEIKQVPDLMSIVETIKSEAMFRTHEKNIKTKEDKPIVAIDTENTGLDLSIKFVGGRINKNVDIISVQIAVSDTKAYYIPIAHTGDDLVINYDWETQVKPFIQVIKNEFFTVYHNAIYDMQVERLHGILIDDCDFACTLQLNKIQNGFEFYPRHIGNYLKKISEHILNRPMIDLTQLLGSKEDVILYNRLSATSGTAYGCSDGVNTYSFFNYLTDPDFERNPYIHQNFATQIEMKTIPVTISKHESGIPVNYDRLKTTLKTIIHRLQQLKKILDEEFDFPHINSDEKVGILAGSLMEEDWDGTSLNFEKFMMKEIKMVIKNQTLKSGTVKRTYAFNDDIITAITHPSNGALSRGVFDYMTDENRNKLLRLIDIIVKYRSLSHEKSIYAALLVSAKRDDRNFSFVTHNLNISGTDTGRFSNKKSYGISRIQVEEMKTKTKFSYQSGDGGCPSVNFQGLSGTKYKHSSAKKLTKIPDKLKVKFDDIKNQIDEQFVKDLRKI